MDTVAMVRALEAKNFPSEQAEALTEAVNGGLKTGIDRIKEQLVKSEVQYSYSLDIIVMSFCLIFCRGIL